MDNGFSDFTLISFIKVSFSLKRNRTYNKLLGNLLLISLHHIVVLFFFNRLPSTTLFFIYFYLFYSLMYNLLRLEEFLHLDSLWYIEE